MINESVFSHAVNTGSGLIALIITPLFLALISKTKNITIPKTIIRLTLVMSLILYGAMGIALLAMLLLNLLHTWHDISWTKDSDPEPKSITNSTP